MVRATQLAKSVVLPVLLILPLYTVYTVIFTPREMPNVYKNTNQKAITRPNNATTTHPPHHSLRIVITAHARGGSTLLGNIFKQHGNTMYWVEPDIYRDLYGVQALIMPNLVTHFPNGSMRAMPEWEMHEYSRATQAMLDCNFKKVPLSNMIHIQGVTTHCDIFKDHSKCAKMSVLWHQYSRCSAVFSSRNSQCNWAKHRMDPSSTCVNPNLGEHYQTWRKHFAAPNFDENLFKQSWQQFETCIRPVQEKVNTCSGRIAAKCRATDANIIKYVRVRLRPLLRIVDDDPTIKALLVTRDPRSIVGSRKSAFNLAAFGEGEVKHTITVCEEVLEDHLLWQQVNAQYSDRIMYIKYEDIIFHPANYTRIMYQHAGLAPTDKLIDWVESQFSCGGKKVTNKFNTCRNVADVEKFNAKWKKLLSRDNSLKIEQNPACKKVFSLLGYKLYDELPAASK